MKNVFNKQAVDEEMKMFRCAVIEGLGGKLYDSEIFYRESNIYLLVLKRLLDEGYDVIPKYDAFLARKDGVSQEQFEEHVTKLVEEKANEYIRDFFNKNKD